MLRAQVQQLHPQIGVSPLCSRCRVILLPPTGSPPPLCPPSSHGVGHVSRVGKDGDRAALLERAETRDDAEELHPVVGRFAETAGNFLSAAAVQKNDAVAARSGITNARSVRVDRDALQLHHRVNARESSGVPAREVGGSEDDVSCPRQPRGITITSACAAGATRDDGTARRTCSAGGSRPSSCSSPSPAWSAPSSSGGGWRAMRPRWLAVPRTAWSAEGPSARAQASAPTAGARTSAWTAGRCARPGLCSGHRRTSCCWLSLPLPRPSRVALTPPSRPPQPSPARRSSAGVAVRPRLGRTRPRCRSPQSPADIAECHGRSLPAVPASRRVWMRRGAVLQRNGFVPLPPSPYPL